MKMVGHESQPAAIRTHGDCLLHRNFKCLFLPSTKVSTYRSLFQRETSVSQPSPDVSIPTGGPTPAFLPPPPSKQRIKAENAIKMKSNMAKPPETVTGICSILLFYCTFYCCHSRGIELYWPPLN